MHPIDRFRPEEDFTSLVAPVLGKDATADLFRRTLDRDGSLDRIDAVAAFFLGEQEGLEILDSRDWENIRETLRDASGIMNMDTLTALMGILLSLGKLR
jgi:hypothetical protein